MVKLIAFLFLSLSLLRVSAQDKSLLSIGHIDNVYSTVLKEERKIWMYNPGAPGDTGIGRERFPVLYLLDAEDHFFSTVSMIKQMAGRWPDMIVVGITNTNRARDLTPAAADGNGQDENFVRFIEKELIPHVDSLYPTAPYRLFSGHSLGGLTVINTLYKQTRLFNAYIAIDPSLWWNKEQLVRQAPSFFAGKDLAKTTLFVGRSNNMPPGMDSVQALKDTTSFTMLYRAVRKFVAAIKQSGNKSLNWKSVFYPEEGHGTVELNAEYDALKFIFSYYQFRTSMFELHPSMNIDSALLAHFKNISAHLGYEVLPSKDLVNSLGYTCMSMKRFDKAEAFFLLNIRNYPADANGYDSIGDLYADTGDTKKAIENYSRALQLGNDPDTKRKLDDLRQKK